MEKLKKLCEAFDQLNVPKDEYVIIGSAPMAIREIRDVNDLDVIVTSEQLERLRPMAFRHDGNMVTFMPEAGCITISDTIDAFAGTTSKVEATIFTFQVIHRHGEDWNGRRVWSLTHMIEFKKKLGRDKDYEDLLMLADGEDPKKLTRPSPADDPRLERLLKAVRNTVLKYHCTSGDAQLSSISSEVIELSRAHDELLGAPT